MSGSREAALRVLETLQRVEQLYGHVEPIDPSPVDEERLFFQLLRERAIPLQPGPGEPGGPSWEEAAPFPGDAQHPPRWGVIPSDQPPGYIEVDPWGKPSTPQRPEGAQVPGPSAGGR